MLSGNDTFIVYSDKCFVSLQVLECVRECPQYAIRECNELYHILTHPFFGVSLPVMLIYAVVLLCKTCAK